MIEGTTKESRAWREVPDPFWSEKFGYEFTPCLALQLMGTEAGRNVFHKDIWVVSLLHRNQGKNTVITDVRFKNEVDLVRKNGGKIVRVVRGPEPEWYYDAQRANDGMAWAVERMKQLNIHVSEWDWIGKKMDYTIYNDGTVDDLKQSVGYIFSPLSIRIEGATARLTPEARHYLRDVLRLAPGDEVELFDGAGGAFPSRIDPGFEALVVQIVRRHAPDLGEGAVSSRVSSGGRYLSVTLTVRAEGRAQLDAIYREFSALPDVLMSL